MHKLKIPPETAEFIRNLHPHLKKKMKSSLHSILSEPYSGKALRDELAGLWSFKVSRFRIIYRIADNKIIEIIAIGPREVIYEETFKLIKKGKGN